MESLSFDPHSVTHAVNDAMRLAEFYRTPNGVWRCHNARWGCAVLYRVLPETLLPAAGLLSDWLDSYRARIEDEEIYPMILGRARYQVTANALCRRLPNQPCRRELARWFEARHMYWLLLAGLADGGRGYRVIHAPVWGDT
jgi:hypothetical protein